MDYQQAVVTVAARRGNPRLALRAMWKKLYITIDDTTRTAVLPVNGHYRGISVVNYANGITVQYHKYEPLTFSHATDAASIAATFGLQEHVDVIGQMIDFDVPATEILPSSNIGEWVKNEHL